MKLGAGMRWALGAMLVAAAATPAVAQNKVVNVYNWAEYTAPDTIPGFEKETGIKVRYDVYDSNDTLQAKLLAGKSGYDVVVPSTHYASRQIEAGLFQKLDKSKIPNWKYLDPDVMALVASVDPGNLYAILGLRHQRPGLQRHQGQADPGRQRRPGQPGTSCSSPRTPPSSRNAASRCWTRPRRSSGGAEVPGQGSQQRQPRRLQGRAGPAQADPPVHPPVQLVRLHRRAGRGRPVHGLRLFGRRDDRPQARPGSQEVL